MTERGFTLAEVITSLMVLGVLVSFTIPVFLESKYLIKEKFIQKEVTMLLQAEIEKSQTMIQKNKSNRFLFKQQKNRVVKSERFPKQKYLVKKQYLKKDSSLIFVNVEVQWKDKQGQKKISEIERYLFIPTTQNRDLPM
jgi:prepilin-type N-terminal cleavage/methylation domain-containing protein